MAKVSSSGPGISESLILKQEKINRKRKCELKSENKSFGQRLPKHKITSLSILEIFRCPMCFETSSIPFKMCSTGHIVCCSCTANLKVERCPLCRKHFVSENPEIVNKILSSIPIKCPYSIFGCSVVYENNSPRKHECFCSYRLISCRDCNSVVPIHTLKTHYEERHSDSYIIKNTETSIYWTVEDPEVSYYECPAMIFDQIFWVLLVENFEQCMMKMFVLFIPIEEPKEDFYVHISFHGSGYTLSKRIKAYLMSNWENEDGFNPHNINIPNEHCLLMANNLKDIFTKESGRISTSLHFTREQRSS